MTTVNVIFAVDQDTAIFLKQMFKRAANRTRLPTDLTYSQSKKLRTNISGYWKVPNIGGTNYFVISWYIPNISTKGNTGLTWVEFLLNKWPNKFNIIGVWNRDGSMYGTKLVSIENGVTQVENQDRVVTMVDIQVVDIEASMLAEEPIYETVQVEEISYVPNGTFIDTPIFDIQVTGVPEYPLHPQYMKIFPDDVDLEGVIIGPASAAKEINNMLGWKPRIWVE